MTQVSRPIQRRALVVCLVLVAGFSALSVRLVRLQWVDRGDAVERSAKASSRTIILPGTRGVIVDCNDEIVARNFPVNDVVADLKHLSDPKVAAWGSAYAEVSATPEWKIADEEERRKMVKVQRMKMLQSTEITGEGIVRLHREHIARVLARPLGMRESELLKALPDRRRGEHVLIQEMHEDVAAPLSDLVRENWIQGLFFRKTLKRWYASSELAAHVVGFVNHEGIGQTGIERVMEARLAGKDGWQKTKVSLQGRLLAPNEGELCPPRGGLHVKLTLDLGLQAIVEEELDAGLEQFIAKQGAVILLDPKTGDILAMASRPTFDLNLRKNINEASFNYAIQAINEPGSVIKIVATSAALDRGLVTPGTMVNCEYGRYRDGKVTVRDDYPKGLISFVDVIKVSNNIGTYKLAKQVGRPAFVEYLKAYGFMKKTGLPLSGEQSGRLADPTNPTNFSRMSYGYASSVTPLQIAMAYGAIANGGNLMKPRIVKEIQANNGMVVESFDPEMVRRVLKERTARQMREALTTVLGPGGTAKLANVPGFEGHGAGKTGTAIKIGPDGKYMHGHYVVSFAGMLPADDPRFVCVVVVDDPLTEEVSRYGGLIAGPIYSKIMERTAAYMSLVPPNPIEPETLTEEEILASAEEN